MRNLSLLLMSVVVCSCFQDNLSPEAALKSFVEGRIGTLVTRDYVLERVTGKMRQSLENISDEEFGKFADLRNVKKESFKILTSSCQLKTCYLTYSISYLTGKEEKTAFTSEVKKIAELVNEDGKWLIADVSNIKTYHESLEPINPLE
jgi:hypothetical protein